MNDKYVIGIDYGTDSVRSIIVDSSNGNEIASAVHYYSRWQAGKYCDPDKNQFRQHPLDYIEGLEITIKKALEKAPKGTATKIKGISVDTTGSTPVAVNKQAKPLALVDGFQENPNAMFVLWKDHTAVKEADEINQLSQTWGGEDYTKYEGGVYSSEWFWAKILHILRKDKKVAQEAFSWLEHCDWIPALLTGCNDVYKIKRSRCAAGHKAMWHESFDGLPSEDFLLKLDPALKGLRANLFRDTYTSDVKVGTITSEWANKLGLSNEVAIGVGAFDAHMGAIGGEIEPYALCKIIGTSTCDILIAPNEEIANKLVKGICGQVDGSVIPNMLGMEAGQSAFGDVYEWFRKLLVWPLENILNNDTFDLKPQTIQDIKTKIADNIIPLLSEKAEKLPIDETGVIAVDWINGRRTPFANQLLKGSISNLNLASDAPKLFKALVESTCFGAKTIVERFNEEGVDIKKIIALGGVAKKSPFVMQTLANVLNMNIKVAKAEQACALGAAMCAATAAGIYSSIEAAQKNMGNGFEKEYYPDKDKTEKYLVLYNKYKKIGKFIEEELTVRI